MMSLDIEAQYLPQDDEISQDNEETPAALNQALEEEYGEELDHSDFNKIKKSKVFT